MEFDPTSNAVIGCAIEVHRHLGPGLLESAYERCLAREMDLVGLRFELQRPIPLAYKGVQLDCGYRIDAIVNETVLLELKSVEALAGIHEAQLLTYMKLANIRIGLLINFNVPLLKKGIIRRIL